MTTFIVITLLIVVPFSYFVGSSQVSALKYLCPWGLVPWFTRCDAAPYKYWGVLSSRGPALPCALMVWLAVLEGTVSAVLLPPA